MSLDIRSRRRGEEARCNRGLRTLRPVESGRRPWARRRIAKTVPGHEIVGIVDEVGADATRFSRGNRIGTAWLRSTCGRCRRCRSGRENLCPDAAFTGWYADGGYAGYATVPEAYAYRMPDGLDDVVAAPLLCTGIVGYRALRRGERPPGGRLGIYGFGASAHVVAQVAIAQGADTRQSIGQNRRIAGARCRRVAPSDPPSR